MDFLFFRKFPFFLLFRTFFLKSLLFFRHLVCEGLGVI
ncbi:hypothetical protein LEP1GSC017_2957 [Leptospira meyeri serovar Hardjo str. Went 5]|nr:hypothetical protein LEP1GSC017_2957 [Leptospira meyeri serovar Hardjo str. Went 5]